MAVNHTKTMPPQLRAARVRKQRVIKAIILTFTLLFLFVPLVSMFVFTIRHPAFRQVEFGSVDCDFHRRWQCAWC